MTTARGLINALQELIDDGDLCEDAAVHIMLPWPTGKSNSGSADCLDVITDMSVWIMPYDEPYDEEPDDA